MTRIRRASITAVFTYLRFGLSITVGIALVPFILHRVGARLYGFWIASGEVLAYAAMADFGLLGVVPWLIAQADGRGDRAAIRRTLVAASYAALAITALYLALVATLWQVLPSLLKLTAADRDAVAGPLIWLALATAAVLPLRVFHAALAGLQDVKFAGALTTAAWALDVVVTVALLFGGYGLWALALGASIPALTSAIAAAARVRAIAPDLLHGWRRPSAREVAALFRESFGTWLGGWGWRLSAATDGIIIAALGQPVWITILAMTSKLGQMLMQMSWVPGDSALVGFAQLSGEGDRPRLQRAVFALMQLYIVLATAAAGIVLAVNPAFVGGWVGGQFFAGMQINGAIAAAILLTSAVHAAAAVASVLGARTQVGIVTLVGGAVQVVLAFLLCRRTGLIGLPLAAVAVQAAVLMPLLAPLIHSQTGLRFGTILRGIARPWLTGCLPLLVMCALAGPLLAGLPLWAAIVGGGIVGLTFAAVAWRSLLTYEPLAAALRPVLAFAQISR